MKAKCMFIEGSAQATAPRDWCGEADPSRGPTGWGTSNFGTGPGRGLVRPRPRMGRPYCRCGPLAIQRLVVCRSPLESGSRRHRPGRCRKTRGCRLSWLTGQDLWGVFEWEAYESDRTNDLSTVPCCGQCPSVCSVLAGRIGVTAAGVPDLKAVGVGQKSRSRGQKGTQAIGVGRLVRMLPM